MGVEVKLILKSNSSPFVLIKNKSGKSVTVNRLVLSSAMLVLKQYISSEKISKISGTPPTPPEDLKRFDVFLKNDQQIEIQLQGLENLRKGTKIRAKIFYRTAKSTREFPVYSAWQTIK